MKIFKTCRTLSLFLFYEILDTKDYKYLIEDYEGVEINEELKAKLDSIWNELFKEYITLKDDKEIRLSFKQLAIIDKLEKKLVICKSLIEGLIYQSTVKGQIKYIKELSAWGYPIDRNKSLKDEIDRVIRNLKTLQSSIKIKRVAFEKIHKKELTQEKINLDKEIVAVEQTLGGGKNIDAEKTMLSKWIEYVRKAKEISKKYERIVK